MARITEIRKTLAESGYSFKRRQLQDSQVVNRGGYIAGEINRQEGYIFLNYAPHADPNHLKAVMDLYDTCQKHNLPHSVSGIQDLWPFLKGGIEFRQGLLKRLDKQLKNEHLSIPEPPKPF